MIALVSYFVIGLAISSLVSPRRLPSWGAVLATGGAGVIAYRYLEGWFGFPGFIRYPLLAAAFGWAGWYLAKRYDFGRAAGSLRRLVFPPFHLPLTWFFMLLVLWGTAHLTMLAGTPILNYDVLSYHLPLAWKFQSLATSSEVLNSPQIFYARLPLGGAILESPFAGWDLVSAHGPGLHLFLAVTILAGAASVWRVTGWLGGRNLARMAAAALYIWHPMVLGAEVNALMDPLVALMGLGAVEWLFHERRGEGFHVPLLLAGLLAGAAISIKLNALGVVGIPLLVLVVLQWRARAEFTYLARIGVFGTGAFLFLFPWISRAINLGGTPAYPFNLESINEGNLGFFVLETHGTVKPWEVRYWGDFFGKFDRFGYSLPLGGEVFLPVLFLCAVGLAVGRRRWVALRFPAAALAGYLFWLTVPQNPARFLLPAAALLIPPAAVFLFSREKKHGERPFRGLPLVLGGLLGISFFFNLIHQIGALPPKRSYDAEERLALVQEYQPYYGETTRIARSLSDEEGKDLLLLFDARAALFGREVMYHTVWDLIPWGEELAAADSAAELEKLLWDRGIRWIYVNEYEWGRLVDFYYPHGEKPKRFLGNMSVRKPVEEVAEDLSVYPPIYFLREEDKNLLVLAEFLHGLRARARFSVPAGGSLSEFWMAPLSQSPNSESNE